ncbi:hypothetical protein F9503_17740 [Escherichia coli]|nr:hypothetical protein [Escherichia coli]
MRISLPVWSQPGYELQLLQIKKLSWKASRNEEDCRVLTVKSNRKISGKPEGSGEAQCCGGFIPGGIGCWREKTPARCRYIPDNITGANLEPRPLKNSRETLSLQHRRLYDARRAGHGLLA